MPGFEIGEGKTLYLLVFKCNFLFGFVDSKVLSLHLKLETLLILDSEGNSLEGFLLSVSRICIWSDVLLYLGLKLEGLRLLQWPKLCSLFFLYYY